MNTIELRNNAKQQLLAIQNIETGVEYLNKVKGIEAWAKAEKKDAELQNLIAEQKLRTQRILGNLIKDGQKPQAEWYKLQNNMNLINKENKNQKK